MVIDTILRPTEKSFLLEVGKMDERHFRGELCEMQLPCEVRKLLPLESTACLRALLWLGMSRQDVTVDATGSRGALKALQVWAALI